MLPIVGITPSIDDRRHASARAYARAIARAGGLPVILPCDTDTLAPEHAARAHADLVHALVLTGGDDPATEPFGEPTHPAAKLIDPVRQAYETALLQHARERDLPTLGVCLGMQMMALTAGGTLDQHLPDTTPTHDDHANDRAHSIIPQPIKGPPPCAPITPATVTSWHHQAVREPGSMRVLARAHDHVIEAIDDPAFRFFLGVQWHPERTPDPHLGDAIFDHLVAAARERLAAPA